jgi:hypothetical protein
MALNRYVLTATVILPPGAFTADAATGLRFGTGSNAQGAGVWGAEGATFVKGTTIVADPAGALFTAIGSGNLRAYVQGQDDVGHAALSN